jgi:hypothetical protein
MHTIWRSATAVAVAASAAVAVAATRAPAESMGIRPTVRTLVDLNVPIAEFAQDDGRVAWMTGRCRDPGRDRFHPGNDAVEVRTLRSGRTVTITRAACRPNQPNQSDRRGGWSGLALGGARVVFWHPVYYGGTGSVSIETHTAALNDRVLAPLSGSGLRLAFRSGDGGALAVGADGDGATLAVGVSDASSTGDECYCKFRVRGGGVFAISGRRAARLGGTPVPAFVDVAAGRIALVAAARSFAGDITFPLPPAQRPAGVEVRDASSGALVKRLPVRGVVLGLALSRETVAVLVTHDGTKEVLQYDARTGARRAAISVPRGTTGIDVDGRTVVYRSGLDIYTAGQDGLVRVRAAAAPIGLSIEAGRVAWAENVGGHGRIRAFTAT